MAEAKEPAADLQLEDTNFDLNDLLFKDVDETNLQRDIQVIISQDSTANGAHNSARNTDSDEPVGKRQKMSQEVPKYKRINLISTNTKNRIEQAANADKNRKFCPICKTDTPTSCIYQHHLAGHFVSQLCSCGFSHYDMRKLWTHQQQTSTCQGVIYAVCPDNLGKYCEMAGLSTPPTLSLDTRAVATVSTARRIVRPFNHQRQTVDNKIRSELREIARGLEDYSDRLRALTRRIDNDL